jgi:succinoglycan biosynthesis transport protein ExoP
MRRPRLHRVFGKERDIGITTAILEATPSVDRIAQPTDVPNLSLVTTGPLPPNPAEILHSAAFMKLLDALRSSFDFVVIDSPPIVPVTDAAVLAATVDATILVVRAFQTSKDMGRRAVRALRDVGGRIVGTVLNSVDLERHAYGYQYYYYYNRDGYAAEEPPSGQGGAGDGNGESRQAAPPS